MPVSKIAMATGILLIVLGVGSYMYALGTPKESLTALIPTIPGVLLLLLGLLALKDTLRKHAMHAAAMIGLLGCLAAIGSIVRKPLTGKPVEWSFSLVAQILMAVLCGGFVVLCVRSFIQARRSRAQKGALTDRA